LGIGFFASLIAGYFSLYILSKMIRKGQLYTFAFYTLLFGIVVLMYANGFKLG